MKRPFITSDELAGLIEDRLGIEVSLSWEVDACGAFEGAILLGCKLSAKEVSAKIAECQVKRGSGT